MDRIWCVPLVVLLASLALATGQEIGTEICACSPRSYEFTLDFSLTCPPVNITLGDGIAATSCLVSPFGRPNVADLVPISVRSIDVLELGQNLRVVAQTDINDVFLDGDSFTYTSVVADPDSIEEAQQIPRALQINMVGTNEEGGEIINVFIVTFSNECGSYPLFEEGESAGWARFTGFGPGLSELCSAIEPDSPIVLPVTTDAPVAPIPSPVAPAPEPTLAPVASGPTKPPMFRLAPTDAPTVETKETEAPVEVVPETDSSIPTVVEELPVEPPVEIEEDGMELSSPVEPENAVDPTEAPVEMTGDPTEAPVDVEFDDVFDYMSMSMGMSMSMPMARLLSDQHIGNFEFGDRRLGIGHQQKDSDKVKLKDNKPKSRLRI